LRKIAAIVHTISKQVNVPAKEVHQEDERMRLERERKLHPRKASRFHEMVAVKKERSPTVIEQLDLTTTEGFF
jgi:hypothetical protein